MVSSVISGIISSIISIYISILDPLWIYTVKFGLDPANAYGIFLNPPAGYIQFYDFLFQNIMVGIASLAILAFALLFLYESVFYGVSYYGKLFRIFFSLFLSYFSLKISYIIIYAGLAVYSTVWNVDPGSWYSLFSITGILSEISGTGYGNILNLLDFLFLTTYFISISSLLFILLLREAAIALIIVIMPIFSALVVFDAGKKILARLYALLIEFSIFPVFILIDLYLIHIFAGMFAMQLALLALAPAVPALLFPETAIHGFHMKSFDYAGYFSRIGKQRIMAGFENAESGVRENSIDWDSIIKKDFEYRRDEN